MFRCYLYAASVQKSFIFIVGKRDFYLVSTSHKLRGAVLLCANQTYRSSETQMVWKKGMTHCFTFNFILFVRCQPFMFSLRSRKKQTKSKWLKCRGRRQYYSNSDVTMNQKIRCGGETAFMPLLSHSYSLSLDPLPPFSFSLSIILPDAVSMEILIGLFGKVTFTRETKSFKEEWGTKIGNREKCQNFKTKIKRVTNEQKMSREGNEGFGCGAETCQGRRRKVVENNRRAGKGEECINKQTAQSKPHACVEANLGNLGETWQVYTIW